MTRAWPLAVSFFYAAGVALLHYSEYARLVARHAWTGATLTIAMGLVLSALAGVIGWFLGKGIRDLLASSGDRNRPALVVASILLFTAYMTVSVSRNIARERRLQAIREEVLTPARIDELLQGTQDEVRALSWNRSAPPDLLRRLAAHPDYSVRANAAAHPSTPAEVAAKLALDPNQSVRLMADLHPSRYKPPVRQ